MRISIGSDHAGYPLKEHLVMYLEKLGHSTIDVGTDNGSDSVDYPDYAEAASNKVVSRDADRAIIVCGSGAGACIVANKIKGIRAAVAHDTYTAHQAVEHDDLNVLCLGARIVGLSLAEEVVDAWLAAEYSGDERHERRLKKLLKIEANSGV